MPFSTGWRCERVAQRQRRQVCPRNAPRPDSQAARKRKITQLTSLVSTSDSDTDTLLVRFLSAVNAIAFDLPVLKAHRDEGPSLVSDLLETRGVSRTTRLDFGWERDLALPLAALIVDELLFFLPALFIYLPLCWTRKSSERELVHSHALGQCISCSYSSCY